MGGDPGGEGLPAEHDGGTAPAVLGVDGGASKTDVLLVAADGSVLGRARGPGSNHQLYGLDTAMDNLAQTVAAARASAGRDDDGPAAGLGCFCLAGVDLPIDDERLLPALSARGLASEIRLHNDTLAVLRAGSPSGNGVAVVCGSGINCAGMGPDGRTVRFPSLGELSGDLTPGGTWLGTRALGLALRARDGRGRPTTLAELVPAALSRADPEAVLQAVYTGELGFDRLLDLAPVALAAAADGDEVAAGAVGQLADEVALLVRATVTRLGLAGAEVDVVLGGGLFEAADGLTEPVARRLRAELPRARLTRLTERPVVGAALLGLDELHAGPEAAARLRAGAAPPLPA
jgi:N-acetylglucosamine kinase-like BadF-type ATPase